MSISKIVRIANGQAFWGDSILGPIRLVDEGPLDYLTLDYLAEVTMSIMHKLKSRDPDAGYATDFVTLIRRIIAKCQKKGIKIIANAGGVNPHACRDAVVRVLKDLGLSSIRVGIVTGDDILPQLPKLIEQGEPFLNLDSRLPLQPILPKIKSANAYIGAAPIVKALAEGADIVITGRAADPSMVLAPLIHEFGWQYDDWNMMAAGTVAGHVIECGAQCTGGNYANWRDVPDFANIGYPVVEVSPDGSIVVTKHDGTGGLVNTKTVTSQLIYEIADPAAYLSPDCSADFTSIELNDLGNHRVRLSGITGASPPETLKVSASWHNGYKLVGQLTVSGPDAVEKARLCADIIFDRLASDGYEFDDSERFVEILGASVCHAGILPVPEQPPEVILRIGARGDNKDKLNRLGREIVPVVTSGPPGVTGYAGGRPKATEVISYWPTLIHRDKLSYEVEVTEPINS